MLMKNYLCPYYGKCLDQAVKANLADFDCNGCKHINDKSQISERDFFAYCLLFARAYRPGVYKAYIETVKTI